MTIVVPGSMERLGVPAYPWSPDLIENMPEAEREVYRELLKVYRKHHFKPSRAPGRSSKPRRSRR